MLPLCATLVSASPAFAETQYVTDQYDFNLRAGQSNRYKIIRTLPSGTPLEIIRVDSKTGYAQVRTEDGTTGYILTRYLQQEPAARNQSRPCPRGLRNCSRRRTNLRPSSTSCRRPTSA
jgi:SH3 domain protein